MLNRITLTGRLCADPELRKTQAGISVCSFRIACDRDFGKGEERETDFLDIVAWRGTAEFVCKYFTKGQMMAVTGSIQTRSYEDRSGNKRKAVEIQANDVSFVGSKRDNAGGDDFGQSYGQSYARPSAPAPQQPAAIRSRI